MADVRRQSRRGVPAGYLTTRLQERLPLSAYRRPFLQSVLAGFVAVAVATNLVRGARVTA